MEMLNRMRNDWGEGVGGHEVLEEYRAREIAGRAGTSIITVTGTCLWCPQDTTKQRHRVESTSDTKHLSTASC